MKKKRGFTLVELLIVIGIIAVLIGILLPTLNAVRDQARRTVCAANLRSIGQSMLMYRNEHKSKWPQAPSQQTQLWITPDEYNFLPMQIGLMQSDSKPSVVWRCPSDDSDLYPIAGSSYAYSDPQTPANKKTLQFAPGDLPVAVETQGTFNYKTPTSQPASISVPVFHGGRLNVLYADFHVDLPSKPTTLPTTGP